MRLVAPGAATLMVATSLANNTLTITAAIATKATRLNRCLPVLTIAGALSPAISRCTMKPSMKSLLDLAQLPRIHQPVEKVGLELAPIGE
jgi:hypothetical protein